MCGGWRKADYSKMMHLTTKCSALRERHFFLSRRPQCKNCPLTGKHTALRKHQQYPFTDAESGVWTLVAIKPVPETIIRGPRVGSQVTVITCRSLRAFGTVSVSTPNDSGSVSLSTCRPEKEETGGRKVTLVMMKRFTVTRTVLAVTGSDQGLRETPALYCC